MLAVRSCTGVPWVGVDADDNDCWCSDSTELDLVRSFSSSSSFSMDPLPPSSPATIDFALEMRNSMSWRCAAWTSETKRMTRWMFYLALPTLSVVFGSRLGGIGAGILLPSVILRGNVAHCLALIDSCC